MKSSSWRAPFRKRVDSVSKSSNSRCRIGITCPGMFSISSGFSSEPERAADAPPLCVLALSRDAGSIGSPSGRDRRTEMYQKAIRIQLFWGDCSWESPIEGRDDRGQEVKKVGHRGGGGSAAAADAL